MIKAGQRRIKIPQQGVKIKELPPSGPSWDTGAKADLFIRS
jgi:hypothetical protein